MHAVFCNGVGRSLLECSDDEFGTHAAIVVGRFAAEDDNGKEWKTTCALIEAEIRNGSLITNAMASATTVRRMYAMAQWMKKRETMLQTLKETIKTEIVEVVKRMVLERQRCKSRTKN